MPSAQARHILVGNETICADLKQYILNGEDFGTVAKFYSSCPSSNNGGDLGEFDKGSMVPEFDQAVFEGEIGAILGPIQTTFGYHLIQIISRKD